MTITLKARDLMDRNVTTIDGSATVANALKKMLDGNIWALMVYRNGLPEGVVTERDILRRCVGVGIPIDAMKTEDVMTTPAVTIGPDARMGEIMQKMVETAVRRVFVVESGKVIGTITQTMLFQKMESLQLADQVRTSIS